MFQCFKYHLFSEHVVVSTSTE